MPTAVDAWLPARPTTAATSSLRAMPNLPERPIKRPRTDSPVQPSNSPEVPSLSIPSAATSSAPAAPATPPTVPAVTRDTFAPHTVAPDAATLNMLDNLTFDAHAHAIREDRKVVDADLVDLLQDAIGNGHLSQVRALWDRATWAEWQQAAKAGLKATCTADRASMVSLVVYLSRANKKVHRTLEAFAQRLGT